MRRRTTLGVAFLFCLAVLSLGSRCTEVKEDPGGVTLAVKVPEDLGGAADFRICHPETLTLGPAANPNFINLRVHAKRREGDCVFVTFRCPPQGPEGSEIRVCRGAPVNTGCSTSDGKPISVEFQSFF